MNKFSFVCFSVNNWEKRKARKQQFMLHLSYREDVGPVLYIEPALNLLRLLLLPFKELRTRENRRRWSRALSLRVEPLSDKLYLFTPVFIIPFSFRFQCIYDLNLFLSVKLIKLKVNKLKMSNIVLWLYHPLDYRILRLFKEKTVTVFDWAEKWTEYFSELSPGRARVLHELEKKIVADSDIVFVVSKRLLKEAQALNKNVHQVYDGTSAEIFLKKILETPHDLHSIRRPIIGYAGTVSFRFDRDMVCDLCDRLPECSFVIVGDVLLKSGDIAHLRSRENIFFLGAKEYSDLPAYLKNFDMCMLPYIPAPETSPPTKVFDYLAAGKPVISTYLPELEEYSGYIRLAHDAKEFEACIKEAVRGDGPGAVKSRIEKAKENSWSVRADEIVGLIKGIEMYLPGQRMAD